MRKSVAVIVEAAHQARSPPTQLPPPSAPLDKRVSALCPAGNGGCSTRVNDRSIEKQPAARMGNAQEFRLAWRDSR